MEKFDYPKAMAELDEIASRIEDPSTVIDELDKYVTRSAELAAKCREYLRSTREKIDKLGQDL